jgi:hypothetical protein
MQTSAAKLSLTPTDKAPAMPPRKGVRSKRQADASHLNAQLAIRISPAAFKALDGLCLHYGGISASAVVQITLIERARALGIPVEGEPPTAGAT